MPGGGGCLRSKARGLDRPSACGRQTSRSIEPAGEISQSGRGLAASSLKPAVSDFGPWTLDLLRRAVPLQGWKTKRKHVWRRRNYPDFPGTSPPEFSKVSPELLRPEASSLPSKGVTPSTRYASLRTRGGNRKTERSIVNPEFPEFPIPHLIAQFDLVKRGPWRGSSSHLHAVFHRKPTPPESGQSESCSDSPSPQI